MPIQQCTTKSHGKQVCHWTHRDCLGGAAAAAPAVRPRRLLSSAGTATGTADVARWQVHGSYHQYHGCRCHLIMLQYRLEQGAVPAVELTLIPAGEGGKWKVSGEYYWACWDGVDCEQGSKTQDSLARLYSAW